MTNEEKYKTNAERKSAFELYCQDNCDEEVCSVKGKEEDEFGVRNDKCVDCLLHWLKRDAKEIEFRNCPYCGGVVSVEKVESKQMGIGYKVSCECGYSSPVELTKVNLARKHNAICRAIQKND